MLCYTHRQTSLTRGHLTETNGCIAHPVSCPDIIWWVLMLCSEIQMVTVLMHTSCSPNASCWFMDSYRRHDALCACIISIHKHIFPNVRQLSSPKFPAVCFGLSDGSVSGQMPIIILGLSIVLSHIFQPFASPQEARWTYRPVAQLRLSMHTSGKNKNRDEGRKLWMKPDERLCNSIKVVAYRCHFVAAIYSHRRHDVLCTNNYHGWFNFTA